MEDMCLRKPHCKVGFYLSLECAKKHMHAVSDVWNIGEWLQEHIVFGQNSADNLAVLHNQNHMVHEFGLSAWITQSGRQVISRSVTSCAGIFFFALCCLGKIPGGAPFSQLHKSGNGSRVDRP